MSVQPYLLEINKCDKVLTFPVYLGDNGMQDHVTETLSYISSLVWGVPLIVLLLGTGIYLTVLLRGIQFRALLPALYLALIRRKEKGEAEGDISQFQALMTALSATVGVGNIAGVATAIAVGGPGALFWMWITGLLGMATKYSEAVLAVKYREVDKFGYMSGGPMYYISKGLGLKWLGVLFAVFASVAAFGIGNMVQSNSVADALGEAFGIPFWITGAVLCIATGLVIVGGIKSIARTTSAIVPFMIIFYLIGAVICLFAFRDNIPQAFYSIFQHALSPTAAAGGFLGATIAQTLRMGGCPGNILKRIRARQLSHRGRRGQDEKPGRTGPRIHDPDVHRHHSGLHVHGARHPLKRALDLGRKRGRSFRRGF